MKVEQRARMSKEYTRNFGTGVEDEIEIKRKNENENKSAKESNSKSKGQREHGVWGIMGCGKRRYATKGQNSARNESMGAKMKPKKYVEVE